LYFVTVIAVFYQAVSYAMKILFKFNDSDVMSNELERAGMEETVA